MDYTGNNLGHIFRHLQIISLVPGNNLTIVFRAVYGERVCACVVVLQDTIEDLTLEDITTFIREKGLASYKLPERMEIFF